MSSQYFPLHKDNSVGVNLNLSGCAKKDDSKNLIAGTSSFALKINLSDLKRLINYKMLLICMV